MAYQFWQNLIDVTIATYYYQYYSVRASRRRMAVSACCTIASAACVYSWFQSQAHSLLFSVLLLVIQIISVLQPLFPYSKQLHAACYIYEDITQLRAEIEDRWLSFNTETSEEEIAASLYDFRAQYDRIENRFASADTFPHRSHLHKKAQKDAKIYLKRYER